MNDLLRWFVGRPPKKLVEEAYDWQTWPSLHFSSSGMDWKTRRAILDREEDFSIYEDDWQFETPKDDVVKFYLTQARVTFQWRARRVKRQSNRLRRYITKRVSDAVRDGTPPSTEVKLPLR